MDVCLLYSVSALSGRGLCDGPIPRLQESYRMWCVFECDKVQIKTLYTYCEQVGRREKDYGSCKKSTVGYTYDSNNPENKIALPAYRLLNCLSDLCARSPKCVISYNNIPNDKSDIRCNYALFNDAVSNTDCTASNVTPIRG
jgi:hypothetical protein